MRIADFTFENECSSGEIITIPQEFALSQDTLSHTLWYSTGFTGSPNSLAVLPARQACTALPIS